MVVLGASFDTPEENRAFAEKYAFPFQLLSVTPTDGVTWGVAENITTSHPRRVGFLLAPDGTIERVWDPADARSFATDVLATL